MKNLEKLTEKEILKLTDEEITLMIKLKKAEEGIKFITYPEDLKCLDIESPKETLFSCSDLNYNLLFEDESTIKEIVKILKESRVYTSDYNSNIGYDFKYIKTQNNLDFRIVENKLYTKKDYDLVKESLIINKKEKELYDKNVAEYTDNEENSKWIEDDIYKIINTVKNKYYNLNNHVYRFKNEYMPLANNDEEIAMNFIKKAYSIDEETEKYIIANYKK